MSTPTSRFSALSRWTAGDEVVFKVQLRGTHRHTTPAQTLERVMPRMAAAGVTRLANITGLDRVGIPVVAAYRPNARSVAVSQGKGLTLEAALASGLMEAVESYHAEHVELPLRLGGYSDLIAKLPLVDVEGLPRVKGSPFHPQRPGLWVEGVNLIDDRACWLPYDIVHTNFSLPLPPGSGAFVMSSNGLASGNHPFEALSHAICEVIERDALTLWSIAGGTGLVESRIDPESVADEECRRLFERLREADIAFGLWDATSDIGIPTCVCVVVDRAPNVFRQLYAATGSGCHPVREIALLRALTEAAQCRLTYISGARDDADREFFDRARDPDRVQRTRASIEAGATEPARNFDELPTRSDDDLAGDLAFELERLRAIGVKQVVAVDLSKPQFDLSVMRVVVPGLESIHDAPGYLPGARGLAALRAASEQRSREGSP